MLLLSGLESAEVYLRLIEGLLLMRSRLLCSSPIRDHSDLLAFEAIHVNYSTTTDLAPNIYKRLIIIIDYIEENSHMLL